MKVFITTLICCIVAWNSMALLAGEEIEDDPIEPDIIVAVEVEEATRPTIISPELDQAVEDACELYNLDPSMVYAVAYTESRFVPDADNGLCYGLMQLNRNYAETFCAGAQIENIYDPANNIKAGCWWLSELLAWADGNEDLRLMAYNLGQSNAKKRWANGDRSTKYTEKVQEVRHWYRDESNPS